MAYHPGVLHLFSSLDRDITLAFLRDYPTPQSSARLGPARMARFCSPSRILRPNSGRRTRRATAPGTCSAALVGHPPPARHTPPTAVLRAAGTAQRPASGLFPQAVRGDAWPITPDAADLHSASPGIGPEITAAILLAEMGEDRSRFPDPCPCCSPRPAPPQSPDPPGASRHRPVPLRREQAHATRHRLVGVRRCPRGRLVPRRLPAGPARGQQHNRALRGLGARWVRILWRCWTDHTPTSRKSTSRTTWR